MTGTRRLPQWEFIAGMAMMSAMVAISIDGMLAALPDIGAELSPGDLNRAQLIITSFVFGMGFGTLFTGALSDAYGRKAVLIGGVVLYLAAALLTYVAPTLETVLLARFAMGLGVAGPRVVSLAVIRDLYAGREMARIVSFVMIVFAIVPALAPMLGAGIIAIAGWREIFLGLMVFAIAVMVWFGVRQSETLPPKARRPFALRSILSAVAEMLRHPVARLAILVQGLAMGMLFSVLSSTQQIFDVTYGQGANFPFWFAGIAVVSASASFVNAKLVVRLGMRVLVRRMLTVQLVLSALMLATLFLRLPAPLPLAAFVVWTTGVFFQAGLTIGNLNALGLEPMGHIAGLAASVLTAFATIAAVVIAVPIGLAFNGTPVPQVLGVLACAALGRWWMRQGAAGA